MTRGAAPLKLSRRTCLALVKRQSPQKYLQPLGLGVAEGNPASARKRVRTRPCMEAEDPPGHPGAGWPPLCVDQG